MGFMNLSFPCRNVSFLCGNGQSLLFSPFVSALCMLPRYFLLLRLHVFFPVFFQAFYSFKCLRFRDFTVSPAVKNPPGKAGNVGSVPSRGTKIPRVAEPLSRSAAAKGPRTATEEPPRPQRRSQDSTRPNMYTYTLTSLCFKLTHLEVILA